MALIGRGRENHLTLLCSKCAGMWAREQQEAERISRALEAHREQEAAEWEREARAFSKRKADDRAAEKQKRLRTLESAGGNTATIATSLRKLKGPELKRLCMINRLMVSAESPACACDHIDALGGRIG